MASGPDYDVLIVGGSYAGLSAAYHLASKGHNIAVLEKQRSYKPNSSGALVYKAAILLEEMGITLEEVVQTPISHFTLINTDFCSHSLSLDLKLGNVHDKNPDYKGNVLSQLYTSHPRTVIDSLKQRCKKISEGQGSVTLVKGALFKGCEYDPESKQVVAEYNIRNDKRNIKARFIIGADGTRSRVRENLGLPNNVTPVVGFVGKEVIVRGQLHNGEKTRTIWFFGSFSDRYAWIFPTKCTYDKAKMLGFQGLLKEDKLYNREEIPLLQIGLCGHRTGEQLNASLDRFLNFIIESQIVSVQKRQTHITVSGIIPPYSESIISSEYGLLIGDAAGRTTNYLTAEGISGALLSGKLAAEWINSALQHNHLLSGFERVIYNHPDLKKMGKYNLIGRIFDNLHKMGLHSLYSQIFKRGFLK